MDIATLIIATMALSGSCLGIGIIGSTRQMYLDDIDEREQLRSEFQRSLHSLVQEHNKLTLQLAEMSERMSDIALRTSMGGKRN